MLERGDSVPDFVLRGYHQGEFDTYRLSESLDAGKNVLVTFYYCDFSPICTRQMCDYSDANWFSYKTKLQIFGISRDGPYSHARFAEENDISYPLLSDIQGRVCEAFDVLEPGDETELTELSSRKDEVNGVPGLPRRAVFLISSEGTIKYAWQTADNWESPELNHVQQAVKTM